MINTGTQFGLNPFAAMQQFAGQGVAAGSAEAAAPQHTVANPTNATSTATNSGGAMMMAPMTMMSPAYMMAYPQMSAAYGAAGSAASAGSVSESAHVTANPTNSTVQDQAAMAGGYGAYGGAGMPMLGGFAMPVMVMAPVFVAFGIPMMYFGGGAQAQPPLDGEVNSVDDVAADAAGDLVDDVADQVPTVPDAVIPDGEGASVDVVPVNSQTESDQNAAPTLPIVQMDAAEFSRYRSVEKSAQLETTLSMELTTKDGDVISLTFNQLDSSSSASFRGVTLEGVRVQDGSMDESTERVVNMSVDGDLNADEQAAIDAVLSSVIQSVQQFFTGDVGASVAQLKAMDFDSAQLSELSLNMSMTKTAQISKAYQGAQDMPGDGFERNGDATQVLEFLASEQKRLVDVAKQVLEAPSAAKLIRTLVPPLLADPFEQLRSAIADADQPDTEAATNSAAEVQKQA